MIHNLLIEKEIIIYSYSKSEYYIHNVCVETPFYLDIVCVELLITYGQKKTSHNKQNVLFSTHT
jgi:hypothetical protein